MNKFVQKGANFANSRQVKNAQKHAKRGIFSTSLNADIIPLIHLHLMKPKTPKLDNASTKTKKS